MSDANDILKSEIEYQKNRSNSMQEITPWLDTVINRYKICKNWRLFYKEYVFKVLHEKNIRNKLLLEFGCGSGENSTLLAKYGATVTGIDVSPELVNKAKYRAGVNDVNIDFLVTDIMDDKFQSNKKYDILLCYAVLHHVDIPLYFSKLLSLTKDNGQVIIVEPVALSSLFKKIRQILPIRTNASPGERQLKQEDITFIVSNLNNCRLKYFNALVRLERFIPNTWKYENSYLTKLLLILLNGTDRALVTIFPFLSKYYGTIAITGTKK